MFMVLLFFSFELGSVNHCPLSLCGKDLRTLFCVSYRKSMRKNI